MIMVQSPGRIDELFLVLRPLCIKIAKNPLNLKYLEEFKSELSMTHGTDVEIWRQLFDYLAFPLQLCVRQFIKPENSNGTDREETEERCIVCVFDVLGILVNNCGGDFEHSSLILALLSQSFLLIDRPPGSGTIVGSSRTIVAVTTFTTLVLNSMTNGEHCSSTNSESTRRKLLENQPILAQLVYASVTCLKRCRMAGSDDDMNQQMEESVVECLDAIISLDKKLCAAFLPGVASGLTEFVINLCANVVSSREQLISRCVNLWTRMVISANDATEGKDFTDEWRRNAALQLSNIFDRLSSTLVAHQCSNVRLRVFTTSMQLLTVDGKKTNCILSDCQKRSLEVIATSIADDQLQIDSSSLTEIALRYGGLIERLLLSSCSRLPRLSKSPLSSEQQAIWRCLLGCLRLLGPNGLSDFLLVDENKSALMHGIIKSLEFAPISMEIKPMSGSSEETVDVTRMVSSRWRRRIPLVQPSDVAAQKLVLAACTELANIDEVNILYEYLYQQCWSGRDLNQALFVTNTMHASCRNDSLINADIVSSFIDLHVERLRCSSALSSLEACLHLEALGNCALRLKTDFQATLVNAFYVVLALVRYADYKDFVWATLFDFAAALKFGTVLEMVLANADYLSSSLSLRLRRSALFPDSAHVFAALLDLLPWESLCAFRGPILETLKSIDRLASYSKNRDVICSLLNVLEQFCIVIVEKRSPEQDSSQRKDSSNPDEDNDEKPAPPWHISMVEDILHRIRSWILADGAPTRLASMRVLEKGLKALAGHEDSLLPMVHQNWCPVLARLSAAVDKEQEDQAIIVSLSAFNVLVAMAVTSKDFVCRRVCDEAWPKIRQILRRYVPETRRANPLIYGQNPSFRLQLCILSNLSGLCETIGASREFVSEVSDICRLYQSKDILPALRQAADACLNELGA